MELRNYRDFCDCLVQEGVLTAHAAREVSQAAADSAPQIGKVLLERGALDMRQLMAIVGRQADLRHRRFGELAVEMGLIDEHELQLALREQRLRRLHPAEILAARQPDKRDAVFAALVLYAKHLEGLPTP